MDPAALRAIINTEPANATRTVSEIDEWLTTPRQVILSAREITDRTIMAEVPSLNDARAILVKLKNLAPTDELIARAYARVLGTGLDIASAKTRIMIDTLTSDVNPALFTSGEAAALKRLGERSVSPWDEAGFPGIDSDSRLYHIAQAMAS